VGLTERYVGLIVGDCTGVFYRPYSDQRNALLSVRSQHCRLRCVFFGGGGVGGGGGGGGRGGEGGGGGGGGGGRHNPFAVISHEPSYSAAPEIYFHRWTPAFVVFGPFDPVPPKSRSTRGQLHRGPLSSTR